MKANWKEVVLHSIFWITTAWLISSGFSIQAQEIELVNGVETIKTIRNESLIIGLWSCIGVSFLLFYTNLWNISRLENPEKKASVFLISGIIFIIVIGLFNLIEKANLTGTLLPLPSTLSLGVITFYFTISVTYGLGKVWIASDKKQQLLSLEKKEAELNLLRNQLQPHFLFNALNNLLSMVDQQKSPQLANSFERLSQLLRYVIEETKSKKVTVGQEIQFIRNYAALQLLRFEPDEVDFQLKINGTYQQQAIEPGLFIPFVENAFKYGTEPEHKASIEVIFDLDQENEIYFSVKNFIFKAFQQNESTGTGIQATKERLDLVYPDKHVLTIEQSDFFFVTLKLITA